MVFIISLILIFCSMMSRENYFFSATYAIGAVICAVVGDIDFTIYRLKNRNWSNGGKKE